MHGQISSPNRFIQVPGAPLTTFNDGGARPRFIFYTAKKITTSEFVIPKKSLPFLAYPRKSLNPFFATPKNLSAFYFATQKNPGVFHRPKKLLLAKISDPKKSPGPHVIKISEWGPWDTSIIKIYKCKQIRSSLLVNMKNTTDILSMSNRTFTSSTWN